MRGTIPQAQRLVSWLLCMLLLIGLSGCMTIRLVGDYDEQIDKGTTALQKEFEVFLVKLEGTAAKPNDKVEAYENHKQFYADSIVAISGLRLRADATERNSLTVRAFDRLANNLKRFEAAHKEGIKKVEITDSFRGGFTSQFTAILTFELAKKRGEKPDEAKAAAAITPQQPATGDKK